jgi:hypothetical protein
MNRQPVKSSNILSIGHEDGAMEIEFSNGRVYRYSGPRVTEHYNNLLAAESVGKHFATHVRNCGQTQCQLVSG